MHRYSVFEMPAYGLGQDASLDLASDSNHIVHAISVGNVRDFLIEDGAGIELRRDVMGRGPDDFHSSFISLLIGVRADKRRQERVVNVDDRLGVGFQELRRQDLHVTREHYKINIVLL